MPIHFGVVMAWGSCRITDSIFLCGYCWLGNGLHILISSGELQGVNGESAAAAFNSLLSDPSRLIFWQTIFMGLCVAVVVEVLRKVLNCRRNTDAYFVYYAIDAVRVCGN